MIELESWTPAEMRERILRLEGALVKAVARAEVAELRVRQLVSENMMLKLTLRTWQKQIRKLKQEVARLRAGLK